MGMTFYYPMQCCPYKTVFLFAFLLAFLFWCCSCLFVLCLLCPWQFLDRDVTTSRSAQFLRMVKLTLVKCNRERLQGWSSLLLSDHRGLFLQPGNYCWASSRLSSTPKPSRSCILRLTSDAIAVKKQQIGMQKGHRTKLGLLCQHLLNEEG